MQIAYDDLGQRVTEYQEHSGAVNTSTSLKVGYSYADGSSNTIRPTKMTYPNGRELNYDYGSSGSTDDALSRVASLIDDDGTTHLVDYSYIGRNTFVKTDYAEPDLRYDLAMGAGDDPCDGFDRFGRVVDSRWYDYGSSGDVDRIKHGYDRAGNRTYREQMCDPNSHHDEVYVYDGINRLTDIDRGTINANKDAISTLKFAQQWSLDPTGNWSGFKEDPDGDSGWDLEQSRTSNQVNEITDISETLGLAWATPVYNRGGNMTTIPKPADATGSFDATYDAWNRLVKLEEAASTVAEYVYDGAKRRVVKKTYGAGQLDETRHFYYTDRQKWQVIEKRLESSGEISANADRQFVWGLRYIDNLILRDRDTDGNGILDERLYALQDANWNVTALADTSGDVQERYAYSAYGTPRVLAPTFTTRASSSYDVEVLYAGYRHDWQSSLYHVRHRIYHAELGRFVQQDPIGYRSRSVNHYWNLYAYANSAPSNWIAPMGLKTAWDPYGQYPVGFPGSGWTHNVEEWHIIQKCAHACAGGFTNLFSFRALKEEIVEDSEDWIQTRVVPSGYNGPAGDVVNGRLVQGRSAEAALKHCIGAGLWARAMAFPDPPPSFSPVSGKLLLPPRPPCFNGCRCSQCMMDARSIFQRVQKPGKQSWLRTWQEIENGVHGRECAGCRAPLIDKSGLWDRVTRDPSGPFKDVLEIQTCCWSKLMNGTLMTDLNTAPNEADYVGDYFGIVDVPPGIPRPSDPPPWGPKF